MSSTTTEQADRQQETPFRRLGIVGAGQMGSGIAEVCARAGLDVCLYDVSGTAIQRGRDRIEQSLERAVGRKRLTPEQAGDALARLTPITDLAGLEAVDLVIEASPEVEAIKLDVFRALDGIVANPDAVLASNTSSIPIMKIAMATGRPEHVVGLHFFNPVPVLQLVEIVPSMLTAEPVEARIHEFVTATLGKVPIRSQDRAGFVVNALLVPYLLAAIRMMESGFASAHDIDNGMVLGCAHPMGPLALCDLVGLDTVKAIAEAMYDEFKEPLYSPPPILLRMVDAGLLGKKSGRGFFEYS